MSCYYQKKMLFKIGEKLLGQLIQKRLKMKIQIRKINSIWNLN